MRFKEGSYEATPLGYGCTMKFASKIEEGSGFRGGAPRNSFYSRGLYLAIDVLNVHF